jgi:hypothetical protein
MKSNEKVTKAVETYVETIVRYIKEYSYTTEVDVDYAEAFNEDNTQESRSAIVTTKLGAVVVMPNFKKKFACATVVNLGTIRQMEMEGFDEEFIEKEGKIYGEILPFSETNAEVFAYYLTHKISSKVLN